MRGMTDDAHAGAGAVTARRATAADAGTLAELRWRWQAEERGDTVLDRAGFVDLFVRWVLDHMATHVPFVVEVGGRVVGMAWLMFADRVPAPSRPRRRTGDVQSVYVVPELRGQGVGAVLLGALLDTAREQGLERVTVHSSERATPFYGRLGFVAEDKLMHWRRPA
jgi:GNAT superfamily N-acetyltransferase